MKERVFLKDLEEMSRRAKYFCCGVDFQSYTKDLWRL